MVGLNGIAARLERLEALLPAPLPVEEAGDVGALIPPAVGAYLDTFDVEQRGYDAMVLKNVITAAMPDGPEAVLLGVQSWTLRFGVLHLADWFGQDDAGWHQDDMSKRRAATRAIEPAAQALLGVDERTVHAWWVGDDVRWLERWREVSREVSREVCEHAGLGAAELQLLQGD